MTGAPERKTSGARRPASRRREAAAPAHGVHPDVLLSLLDQGVRFDAEYREGLSNHLPMALVALRRLGASDERLRSFAASYVTRLQPAPPSQAWSAGDPWADRLGQREAWPAYRALFAEWLSQEGAASVLEQVLPLLMTGCGAAAFHAMIRTSYAMQVGHAGELADGLAYWACRFLPLGAAAAASPPVKAVRDAQVVLKALRRASLGPHPSEALIFQRMNEVARHPEFARQVARLAIDGGTLEALARHGAELYAASGDFTVLHLVTSAHAARVLEPFCEDPEALRLHYWRAYAAAHRASAAEPGDMPQPPWSWEQLIAFAVASDDAHAIKLVDSCRELEKAWGEGPWRAAATRALRPAA